MAGITRRDFGKMAGVGLALLSGLRINAEEDPVDEMAKSIVTVVNNGPKENRFNIVSASEAYKPEDEKNLIPDIQALHTAREKYEVFSEYEPLINRYAYFVHSADNWRIVTWSPSWKSENKNPNTAFQILVNGRELIMGNKEFAETYEKACKKMNAHAINVLVNNDGDYGAGSPFFISTKRAPTFYRELGCSMGNAYENCHSFNAINASADANPPWKQLIGKVEGIGMYEISEGYFRGEKQDCLAVKASEEFDQCRLCKNGSILAVRKAARPIESAPDENTVISRKRGQSLSLEITVVRSRNYSPEVLAFYRAFSSEQERDKMAENVFAGVPKDGLARDYFKARKGEWTPVSLAAKKNGCVANSVVKSDNALVVFTANDPNPDILLRKSEIEDKRVYRIKIA